MQGKKNHHHNPKKFKFGILRHSLVSTAHQPKKIKKLRERSVSFIENSEPESVFKSTYKNN
jgi:hypothetical protein